MAAGTVASVSVVQAAPVVVAVVVVAWPASVVACVVGSFVVGIVSSAGFAWREGMAVLGRPCHPL